jgi:hypothetical protein
MPGDANTTNSVSGDPPSNTGATQVISATALAVDTAITSVGLPGTGSGVTPDETVDVKESPTSLVEMTVNVYWTPLVRPEMSHVSAGSTGWQVFGNGIRELSNTG